MFCYMVPFGMFCILFPDDLTWVSDFSGRSKAPNSLKWWGMRDLSPLSWDMLRCNGVILCYFDSHEENDDTTVIGILQCCNHHRLNACLQQWWGGNQRHSDIVGILAAAFGRAHHQNGSAGSYYEGLWNYEFRNGHSQVHTHNMATISFFPFLTTADHAKHKF
jgi:hypothetical protein